MPPRNKNEYGFTPMITAALYNSLEVARLLIEKGADIEVKDIMEEVHLPPV